MASELLPSRCLSLASEEGDSSELSCIEGSPIEHIATAAPTEPKPKASHKKPAPGPSKQHIRDHTIVNFARARGARKLYDTLPVVRYTEFIERKCLYVAGSDDAYVLCPVPDCGRVFKSVRTAERHVHEAQFGDDIKHRECAQSEDFVQNRLSKTNAREPPRCRFCNWRPSSGRVDAARHANHERICRMNPVNQ